MINFNYVFIQPAPRRRQQGLPRAEYERESVALKQGTPSLKKYFRN